MNEPTHGEPRTDYSQAGNRAFETRMAERTVAQSAGFLLPHLSPGMSLLDVGCGPGSITAGLATAVAPGQVVGIDFQESQVAAARKRAASLGIANARFHAADAYALPFDDESFDVVFAHAVLVHLGDPLRALKEMRRVLRPGGLVGLRDPDLFGSGFTFPMTELLELWREIGPRVRAHNGANPHPAREHRRLLREAGFGRTMATASVVSAGSADETREQAVWFQDQFRGFARTAVEQAWMDQATADAIHLELAAWGERPDAFHAGVWCATLGWR